MEFKDFERERQENEMFARHAARDIARDGFGGLAPNVLICLGDMRRGTTLFPLFSDLRH